MTYSETYLGTKYRLDRLTVEDYSSAVLSFAASKKPNRVAEALEIALQHEDTGLASVIKRNALSLHNSYSGGDGMYVLTVAVSVKALRSKNKDVKPIGPDQWTNAMERELELSKRPAVTTLELLGGLGLAEVRDVNPGYVNGFQAFFQSPEFIEVSGITGLAALHSHDLMHFASQT